MRATNESVHVRYVLPSSDRRRLDCCVLETYVHCLLHANGADAETKEAKVNGAIGERAAYERIQCWDVVIAQRSRAAWIESVGDICSLHSMQTFRFKVSRILLLQIPAALPKLSPRCSYDGGDDAEKLLLLAVPTAAAGPLSPLAGQMLSNYHIFSCCEGIEAGPTEGGRNMSPSSLFFSARLHPKSELLRALHTSIAGKVSSPLVLI